MSGKVKTAEMSWKEVEEKIASGAAAIVPMDSTEEHGPHSPTGDYLITDAIAEQVAAISGAVVTPSIAFGYSEYFRHYPGTISVQGPTLRLLVRDVVGCLLDQGFKHVILFNGHKGNDPILSPLVREIRRERGVIVPIVSPLAFGLTPSVKQELFGDEKTGHGGEPIGSIMTYLHPEWMRMDLAGEFGTNEFLGKRPDGLSGIVFDGTPVGMAINMGDITPPT